MAVIRQCRVCGKDYEFCHSERPTGTFRWQEVACSPECGAKYLAKVAEARNSTPLPTPVQANDFDETISVVPNDHVEEPEEAFEVEPWAKRWFKN